MEHETAGDPMTGLKWTRRTTAKIAAELHSLGIEVSDRTVARLLRQMDFSLRVNHKKLSRVCGVSPEERDAQFVRIAEIREQFAAQGLPLISVDTKKKELVGRFKNAGTAWNREAVPVNDHDFRSDAEGIVAPYGIYDLLANRGTVFVGTSYDTPEFAVDSIEKWWRCEGRRRYGRADRIGILADGGGSNGPTCRAWKYGLHRQLSERHGLTVTVAHYPSGASKWNPIEHRLFSEITKNWAGRPLDSYDTILNYLRTTTTTTGLRVRAHLVRRVYEKGVKIPDAQMRQLPITQDPSLPRWNYTLHPS
jgi:hypothetical protein